MATTRVSASPAAATPAAVLAASATDEWAALVGAAVLGTDRRPAPDPLPGWDTWARANDPAVALLDRAAAVVVARRAGACPQPPPDVALPIAPPDSRPPCPAPCAVRLARLLGGEHDLLLPEWFERCEAAGIQLPWASLPALLLKARRNPSLDAVVRRLAAGRASWLAEVVPELGVKVAGTVPTSSSPPFVSAPRPPDSGAVVTSILNVFYDRIATWATAPEMRLAAAAIDPAWLPSLVVELSRIGFDPVVERTRRDVLALAEFRHEMHREFDAIAAEAPSPVLGQAAPMTEDAATHEPQAMTLAVYADYCQFYVQDLASGCDTSTVWDDPATTEHGFAVGDGLIAVGTKRYGTVDARIEWYPSDPGFEWAGIDRVSEGGIVVTTQLGVGMPISVSPLPVVDFIGPGAYAVRSMAWGLDTVESDSIGNDHYIVQLWPVEAIPPVRHLVKPVD